MDAPVSIHAVERFLGDRAVKKGWNIEWNAPPSGKRILIVGAGPSGLSAAYHLAPLMRHLQAQDLYDPVLDGLVSAFKYDKTYFDKIVSSVGPLMEKLTTGHIAGLISPDYQDTSDTRPIFEWLEVIRRKGIVYVGLDALTDTTVASAVGNSMFADLVSVAGHIYKHGVPGDAQGSVPTISLHADEFNELIGEEFVPLLNKAGGAGFQVTAYTQTWSDVEARIGNRAKAGQVAGNFNTLIMLRVKELATAEMLTDQLPRVEVFTLMSVSGVDDSSEPGSEVDFKSRNEDRISVSEVPMLTPAELITLPKGQAFALLDGGQLWKIRIPLPATDSDMPENLTQIANEMERTYIRICLADIFKSFIPSGWRYRKRTARDMAGLLPGITTHQRMAKTMGERTSAEQGQNSRWWQVQGDALPVHDSLTGD
jgi:hypothetical protein